MRAAFTLPAKAKVFANRVAQRKSVVLLARHWLLCFTLSVRQGIAKLSARAKSAIFALARNFIKIVILLAREIILIIYCAFENHVSQKAHSICRILTAFEKRVNLRP